jgi:uncharacterized membrane protein YGL010W
MRTLPQWLTEYDESHRNPTNIKIHVVAVPLIYFSIVALLYSVALPLGTLAHLIMIPVLLFYFSLSLAVGAWMTAFSVICLGVSYGIDQSIGNLAAIAIGIFVIAWIFQFIGHKIEGKKPSFFKDLVFLLIGPVWTLSHFVGRHWATPTQAKIP